MSMGQAIEKLGTGELEARDLQNANAAFLNSGSLGIPDTTSAADRYFGPTLRLAETAIPEPGIYSLLITISL